MPELSHCPLCSGVAQVLFHSDKRRTYRRCSTCLLVYVPADYYLDSAAERAEYDKHQNTVDDSGYRRFLGRLSEPMLERIPPSSHGLDFGCGPGPALAQMLIEHGHRVDLYDIYYQPDKSVLTRTFDFICATEVVEHLHQPGLVLDQLWELLAPGAYLGLMTKMVLDEVSFARWHYKNDPTHVCFYSRETFQWWAGEKRASLEFIGADVIVLRKPKTLAG